MKIKIGEYQYKLEDQYVGKFIIAGKAIITVKNIDSGNHFTFSINQCKDIIENKDGDKIKKPLWFVSVCRGYDEWLYIGLINEKLEFIPSKKIDSETISIKSFKWIIKHYIHSNDYDKRLEFYHEGYCGKCGRMLTEPESIKCGFGPYCITTIK